ncbi:MAG: transposase [Actinomycetota bacterium]
MREPSSIPAHLVEALERLHKEVKRRTHVVGIFPDRKALLPFVGMLLAQQDDKWAVADRRYFSLESMRRLYEPEGGEAPAELVAAIA